HGVVHERGGDELPSVIEMDIFHEDLACALGYSAVNLTVEQQGIEHGSEIVHHAVARDVDFSGLTIDLQLADMAAVWIIVDRRTVDRSRKQSGLHAFRQIGEVEGSGRDLFHG